jgi:chemotaxis protein MotB
MKKQIKKEDKDVVPGYMATYGDMVTLLMAFFVLLYAMSDPDPGKFEDFSEAMTEELSGEEVETQFESLEQNLQEIVEDQAISESVEIEMHPEGIEIKMEGKALFNTCSADVLPKMESVISNISNTISELLNNSNYKEYVIEVKGHTDNLPPTLCPDFDTNWELSAYRATGVVTQFIASGIDKKKIVAIAMADSKPLIEYDDNSYSRRDIEAANRRVEIFINKFNKFD